MRWIARRAATARRGQSGYTLMEVMIAIGITGILIGPLFAWAMLVVRQQPITRDGAVRSAQTGILSTYFPRDVVVAGAADDYKGSAATAGGQWDTWRQECTTGNGRGGRDLVVLLTGGAEPSKTIYSVAPMREGNKVVAGKSSLWRTQCGANTGITTSSTQVMDDVVNTPAATSSSCYSSTLANGQPDAPCRQIRLTVTSATGGNPAQMSATRRTDARSLDVAQNGNLQPTAQIKIETELVSPNSQALRVTFSAAESTDPEGGALTYRWELPTGPEGSGAPIEVASGVSQVRVLPVAGNYWVRLKVTDPDGGVGYDYAPVEVENREPIAVATVTPTAATAGQTTIDMDASQSRDPDGSGLSYSWLVRSDLEAAEGLSVTFPSATATFAVPEWAFGSIVLELTVTDANGASAQSVTLIPVTDPTAPVEPTIPDPTDPTIPPDPGAPVAVFTAGAGSPSTAFDFDASTTTGTITSYAWDFGLLAGAGSTAGPTVSHTFPASGTYTVSLTVTDDQGRTATKSQAVQVPGGPSAPTNVRVNGNVLAWDPRPGTRRYVVDLESVANGCARSIANQAVAPTASPTKVLPPNPCAGESTVRARVGVDVGDGSNAAWSAWIVVPQVVK